MEVKKGGEYQIVIGMNETDYESLKKDVESGQETGWTCHKDTKKGDKLFFYFGKKFKRLVATGIAVCDAWVAEENGSPAWKYAVRVGYLKLTPDVITLEYLKKKLPGLTWLNQPRQSKILGEREANKLLSIFPDGFEPFNDKEFEQKETRKKSRRLSSPSKLLYSTAIYVNASPERLLSSNKGNKASTPIEESKPWSTGARLLLEAEQSGKSLPLVFGYMAELLYWAVAEKIEVIGQKTLYSFRDLRRLGDFERQDLIVQKTGSHLPNHFIRSYALVETPDFLDPDKIDDLIPGGKSYLESSFITNLPPTEEPLEPEDDFTSGLEGEEKLLMVLHRRRELGLRNKKINEELLRGNGRLICSVRGCNFDFLETYGPIGSGFAHVHHLKPLGLRKEAEITCLDDLAIVCANCHAMIHRGGECRDLDSLIVKTRNQNLDSKSDTEK